MDFGEGRLEKLYDFSKNSHLDFYQLLATSMFRVNIPNKKLEELYRMVLGDFKCFPIPADQKTGKLEVAYENSWKEQRSYGGERVHEGCDIMGTNRPSGYYPVISVSDGVVEKIGWLKLGGWRIGIRSKSGVYFYYAHLNDYFKKFKEGEEVKAGQILGFMGDSGYSEVEGTTGNFPSHLHFGVYIRTDLSDEVSINPYYILKFYEKDLVYYSYINR
ncbi:hypothetical protein P261_01663 [Lachnospiraceae bacterium TWA4]|nr:hypothetical protein P261_01663 [Lachnospiraceae bacterium TWA4]